MDSEDYISELVISTLKVWLDLANCANCAGATIKWTAYSVRPGVKEFNNYKTEDILYGKTSHSIREWISIINHFYVVVSLINRTPASSLFFQNSRDGMLKLIAKYIERVEKINDLT